MLSKGIDVIKGAARCDERGTLRVDEQTLVAQRVIIATGARPHIIPIPGLETVPYLTTDQLFQNERLPASLIIIGAGPTGTEVAQAYRRLGSQVALIDSEILPGADHEISSLLANIFDREGVRFVAGEVSMVTLQNGTILAHLADGQAVGGDQLLVATGRRPNIGALGLDAANIEFGEDGIRVNEHLQTTAKHVYAAGDCTGGFQFTHYAGWQGYQAARNALLPGRSRGILDSIPWTVFTDPEVAHVGLAEPDARKRYGDRVSIVQWGSERVDRAISDAASDGFVRLIHHTNGKILGATIVSPRAGELINEVSLAIQHGLTVRDVAEAMHVYPSYSMPLMRMSAERATGQFFDGLAGRIAKRLSIVR